MRNNLGIDLDFGSLYPYPAQRRDRRARDRSGMTADLSWEADAPWNDSIQRSANTSPIAQREIEFVYELERKIAQWEQARKDRRKLLRAPVMTRVFIDGQEHMLACDVSTRGLRCSGRPKKTTLDVEFKIPGLPFPIDAKAEVIEYFDRPVIPLVNMKFVDLDTPYESHIEAYVNRRLAHTF
ncbi:MAG: PilZ domain-containing protein [Myxococcota bacterium]